MTLTQFWPHHHKLTFGDATSELKANSVNPDWSRGLFWYKYDSLHSNVVFTVQGTATLENKMTTQFKQISPPLRIGERKKSSNPICSSRGPGIIIPKVCFLLLCLCSWRGSGQWNEIFHTLFKSRHLLYNFNEKSKHSLKELTKFEGAQTVP